MNFNLGVIKEPELELDLLNLIKSLNILCNGISFSLVEFDRYLKDEFISHPESFRKILSVFKNKKDYDWIIYLTEKPFDNNFFYDGVRNLIIISFYNWNALTSLSKNNGLIYFTCALFAEMLDKAEKHHINTGCIFDFLGDKRGIDEVMKKGSICPDCYHRISSYDNDAEELFFLDNLNVLMKELSNASIWNRDIVEYWKSTLKNLTNEENIFINSPIHDFSEIIELVKNLELNAVFQSLEKLTNNNIKITNTLILLAANWKDLKNKEVTGVIDLDTFVRLRNRIVLSVLEIINELKLLK